MHDLEDMLHRFSHSYTYGNAPVERAQHFVHRLDDFMKLHILGQKGGGLGTVQHYTMRLELQQRGCLHAHIILWFDNEQGQRVLVSFRKRKATEV